MTIRFLLCLAASAVVAAHALAQPVFPGKPVKLIVPNAAGGPSDLVGRVLAQKLAELWGQGVVVENRVGAGGNIGVDAVVKALPDGYTLLVTNSAPIVVNQSLYSSVPYNSSTDLAAVSLLASAPQVLVVPAASEFNSVGELIRAAKANPGKYTFASLGNGTSPHLAGEMFKSQAGVDLLHIPYRAVPQVYAAIMTNEVSMFFDVPSVFSQVKAGKMKALAVSTRARYSFAPEVPTMVESGLPDYEMGSWYGLLAPAGTSRELVAQLHADTLRALNQPDTKAKFNAIGFEIVGGTPEQFAAHIKTESERWAKVIKAANIRAN